MIVGLVDCNNFYCSCERVFQPELRGKPIVVLSNNDGCVIARSAEAKTLGIPMGAPYFKHRKDMERQNIVVRSSNYALYGDMSNRVMTVLAHLAPNVEVYSIDECFLDLNGLNHMDLTAYARHIKETVEKWTGIPVAIGIGSTKTLAKIANRLAKKSTKASGVLDLSNSQWVDHALAKTEVGDVWGIGRRWASMLTSRGVHTAKDLRDAEDGWVRQKMGVVGLRTVMELRGTPCVDLEVAAPDKQTVCVSRSFGSPMTEQISLHDAISTFAMRAAEKIRKAGLVAGAVNVFVRTDPFRSDQEQYSNSATIGLTPFTNHTQPILSAAQRGLWSIFRENYRYKKAGILLLDLVRQEDAPRTLFDQPCETDNKLMSAFDAINNRFGTGSVSYGQLRKTRTWYMTQNHVSPHYTTRWDELPLLK